MLPGNFVWEEFRDQILVVRPKLLYVGRSGTLGIQVVDVELIDPAKVSAVLIVHEIAIRMFSMGRVERVEAKHVLGFERQVILGHLINVLIVPP